MADRLDFLTGNVVQVARRLLGCMVVRELDGKRLIGKIVETEAYHQSDAASHSYNGRTPRTEVMFGPAGFWYVYFTYGMHYCMNVVTGQEGEGSAVLIRAIEPISGLEYMREHRRGVEGVNVTNGPAKTCQALAVDKQYSGHAVTKAPLRLIAGPAQPDDGIVATTRIGITKDTHRLWRFYCKDNPFVSRP